MHDLEKTPLCREADIEVYRPSLDFFIDKIKRNDFFSFTRQMHGLWDAVIGAWILEPSLRKIRLEEAAYRVQLAEAMTRAKSYTGILYYEPHFYAELLEILGKLNPRDTSFLFGVSDTYFFPEDIPPYTPSYFTLPHRCPYKYFKTKDPLKYYKARFGDRHTVIKLLLPDNYPFFDAALWKRYCYNDEIWDFFAAIKEHPVVLIGAEHHKYLGKIAGLDNFTHISIHGSRASVNRQNIMEQVIQAHKQFPREGLAPIYFFMAGSVSVYLVYHLHDLLERKFLIDVGQAFNFLYDHKYHLYGQEFGFSRNAKSGRNPYQTNNMYGERNFRSSMEIIDNEVHFDLKLKFREVWFEKLMLFLNEKPIRRKLYEWKHRFNSIFRNA